MPYAATTTTTTSTGCRNLFNTCSKSNINSYSTRVATSSTYTCRCGIKSVETVPVRAWSVLKENRSCSRSAWFHTSVSEPRVSVSGLSPVDDVEDNVGDENSVKLRRHRGSLGGGGGDGGNAPLLLAGNPDLLTIPGVGPRNLRKLVEKGIGGVAELKKIYKDKRIFVMKSIVEKETALLIFLNHLVLYASVTLDGAELGQTMITIMTRITIKIMIMMTMMIMNSFHVSSPTVPSTTRACQLLLRALQSLIIFRSLIVIRLLTACYWTYCGEGTCNKTHTYKHTCDCNPGYTNLMNISHFPCFSSCAITSDCSRLGVRLLNDSSSPNGSSSGNSNEGIRFLPGGFHWIGMIVMSIAMGLWN